MDGEGEIIALMFCYMVKVYWLYFIVFDYGHGLGAFYFFEKDQRFIRS